MADESPMAVTEVISESGVKEIQAQKRLLDNAGIDNDILCPPGSNPNG